MDNTFLYRFDAIDANDYIFRTPQMPFTHDNVRDTVSGLIDNHVIDMPDAPILGKNCHTKFDFSLTR